MSVMDILLYMYAFAFVVPYINLVLIGFLCYRAFRQNRPIFVKQQQPGFYAKKIVTKKTTQ